jgi:drug/metabolite transporter (DMT)-like permease
MIAEGEIAALVAAGLWACSSVVFGGTRLPAWSINFSKNLVGATLMVSTLVVLSLVKGTPELQIPLVAIGWLALSGVIGLTIGDTFYFRSLQILGPRRSLVMTTSTPIFGAVLGWLILGEAITPLTAAGILLATMGLSVVVLERRASVESPGLYPGRLAKGILAGLAGSLCQATGLAISRIGMQYCTPQQATACRLTVAVLLAIVLMLLAGKLRQTVSSVMHAPILKRVVPAAAMGTWMGIWLSQVAVANTPLAVAATLLATSPLFAIPLIRIVHGHRVSWRAVAGNLIAIAGIALVVARDYEGLKAMLGNGPATRSGSSEISRPTDN